MKLNLGCGDRYVEGWINVDLPNMPHRKDQSVDLTGELPWADKSIECVYAGHVLEHMELVACHEFLTRLYALMVPGAPIMLVGPDVEVAQKMIDNGAGLAEMYGATMDSLKFGAGRWSGDVHQWECTARQLEVLLEDAGWSSVVVRPMDEVSLLWPVADPRPQWQCAVGAVAL